MKDYWTEKKVLIEHWKYTVCPTCNKKKVPTRGYLLRECENCGEHFALGGAPMGVGEKNLNK